MPRIESAPDGPQPPEPDIEPDRGFDVAIADTQAFLAVDPEWLSGIARRVLRNEGIHRATISVALVDDAAIHRLNRVHLGHDWPTDVISFVLSEPDEEELAGELVISTQTARKTAREMGIEERSEVALYLIHGLLHLCGYDDIEDEARRTMRERESAAMRAEGLIHHFPMAERDSSAEEPRKRSACSV